MGLKKSKTMTFHGGYHFRGADLCKTDKVKELPLPPKVIIPLSQGFGMSCDPLVKEGDEVKAGQIIAQNDKAVSSPIHSSVKGKVTGMRKMNYFNREVFMVEIKTSGEEGFEPLEGYSKDWEDLSPEKIEELLYLSGVSSLDREGIPTRFKSSVIDPESVSDIIVHGCRSEPYNISLQALLSGKDLYGLVDGIKILQRIMPNATVHLAIDSKGKVLLESLGKLVSNLKNIRLCPVLSKYPQGYDEVLVPTLTGKKFPYGYSAANVGVVVLNIQAVLQAWRAVTEGKPLIERTVALLGPAFKENTHMRIRVGTPLEHILKNMEMSGESRLMLNSPMTGVTLNDTNLPIDRTFSQIVAIPEERERKFLTFLRPGVKTDSLSRSFLSSFLGTKTTFDTNMHGEQRPCIQCGYCIEACPVRINPALLSRQANSGTNEIMMQYGVFNCIDCNLCSYVCPSKIPVASDIAGAKTRLIDMGCDHSLCILPRFDLKGLEEYKGVKKLR